MGYKRADEILPEDILMLVQNYISGASIYVPRKTEKRRKWGSCTGIRENLSLRNQQIYDAYQSGITVKELAERYYITEKSIQRILRNIRKTSYGNQEILLGGKRIESGK